MIINITTRHADISEALKTYAHDKLDPVLAGYPQVEHAHIILDVQKFRHIVEVVVQARRHVRIEAQAVTEDMYKSIDQVADRVDRQLRRAREKIVDHKGVRHRTKLADFEQKLDAAD